MTIPPDLEQAPVICPEQTVIEDWIDYNGHLNMAFYNVIFDRGVDHVYDLLGIGAAYAQSGQGSCFTMEVHLNYLSELSLGDRVFVHFQLLDYDSKRVHFFEQLYHQAEGYLAATSEQIGMHVDMQTRRSAPFPDPVIESLEQLKQAHSGLAVPPQVGHVIAIPKRAKPGA
ncbi:MAG: thioesterase family protein [Pseudomonadaceae bacterium]|nr:thioesterase family protein [Pseudomonadaceae bacterium]